MSSFTTAFDELYSALKEAMGTSPVCASGADSGVDCIFGENGINEAFYGGGVGNRSQMTLQTKLSDWTTIPESGDSITVSGMAGSNLTRAVLSTDERNGILYITIGDPSL